MKCTDNSCPKRETCTRALYGNGYGAFEDGTLILWNHEVAACEFYAENATAKKELKKLEALRLEDAFRFQEKKGGNFLRLSERLKKEFVTFYKAAFPQAFGG